MKRWTRGALAAALAVIALLAPAAPAARAAGMPDKFKPGDAAPDFTLKDLSGKQVQLAAVLKEKVVLLAFWSVRCGACIGEAPYLNKIHQAWSGKGVAVLSVVTDGMDAATTAATMKEAGVAPAYPVLLDPEFTASDTYTNFIVPHTLVIDRTGTVRYVHTGFQPGTEKEYEAALSAALK